MPVIQQEAADYYDVLGCAPHSDHDQIQAEYRAYALQLHPDKAPEHRDRWERIREAYEVLGDPQRRAQYDRWRVSRAPMPFSQWLASHSSHTMHWSFDYQRSIQQQQQQQPARPDIYAMFRCYEI